MNEQRTTSILQRLPLILAVTAASYGLQAHAQNQQARSDRQVRQAAAGVVTASALERMREEVALHD